jgi:hypothetical protein
MQATNNIHGHCRSSPTGTSMFIQDKGVSTRATVLSVPFDSSDTSDEYHYYTVNIVTGATHQVTRTAIIPDHYTTNSSELKHNDTGNGIMSLPLWFRHNQKIMLEVDGTYTQGYLQIMLNDTCAFVTLDKQGKLHTSQPLPNLAFD